MTRTRAKIEALKVIAGWIDAAKKHDLTIPEVTDRQKNLILFEIGELRYDLFERAEQMERTEGEREKRRQIKIAA